MGLATSYPGDVGIETDPAVIWVERMNASVGTITARYEQVLQSANLSSVADVPAASPLTNSLRMNNTASGTTRLFKNLKNLNASGYTTLYLRVYVKFEAGGAFHHNGPWVLGQSGDPNFTPALCCELPTGADKFYSSLEYLHATGYTTWMGMRPSTDTSCTPSPCYYGNTFAPLTTLNTNQWYCLEQAIVLNNPTSAANGTMRVWIDGVPVVDLSQATLGSWTNNEWTTKGAGANFDGFRWRSANFNITNFFLEHYTDAAGAMRYSHLVVATAPIGRLTTVPGIAGPDQAMAEGLIVALGDPATAGEGPGTDTWLWTQVSPASPLLRFSHKNLPNTMIIAPPVTSNTTFRFQCSKNSGATVDTCDITVTPLVADDLTNSSFVDLTIGVETTDTYNPVTRLATGGSYKCMGKIFSRNVGGDQIRDLYPAPTAGWRYIFRGGTYGVENTNPNLSGNPNACWPTVSPILRISVTGAPTAPIQLKAYRDSGTGIYEVPVLSGTGSPCTYQVMLWVCESSSYVIVEGFDIVGDESSGTGIWLGGTGFGTGGVSATTGPVHHVTVRHVSVHGLGALHSSRGVAVATGPAHELLWQYVHIYDTGAQGFEMGVSHTTDKTLLPYNVWMEYILSIDHNRGLIEPAGGTLAGARHSLLSHYVEARCADGGSGTQGPWDDDNIVEYVVSHNHDRLRNPALNFSITQRGYIAGNVNPLLATQGPIFYSGANRTLLHHIIAFDNQGIGFDDAEGDNGGKWYHVVSFNNALDTADPGVAWAGIGMESRAGDQTQNSFGTGPPHYPAVTLEGTLANSISYHTGNNARDLVATPGTILITNHPPADGFNTINPKFITAVPSFPALSGMTVDENLYTDASRRVTNPNFGDVPGLHLQATSPAINAGTLIAGFHCPLADDNGQAPDPNCIHWRGTAPDLGAYEFTGGAIPNTFSILSTSGSYGLTGTAATLTQTAGPLLIKFVRRT